MDPSHRNARADFMSNPPPLHSQEVVLTFCLNPLKTSPEYTRAGAWPVGTLSADNEVGGHPLFINNDSAPPTLVVRLKLPPPMGWGLWEMCVIRNLIILNVLNSQGSEVSFYFGKSAGILTSLQNVSYMKLI